jgi:hypothetical protein
MKYTKVLNPQWANVEHTLLNCDVDFDDLKEELVPFTAVASGDYEHSHQIFAECIAGDYGIIAEYVEPPVFECGISPNPTKAELMAELASLTVKIQALEIA